jgi:hypothetical protein
MNVLAYQIAECRAGVDDGQVAANESLKRPINVAKEAY